MKHTSYLVDLDQFTRSSSQVAVLKGESEVNFKAYGEVVLMHATIDGNLECNNGQFINPNGSAITADSIYVKGNVFLSNGFKAEGKVSLHGSTIGGNLECEWSQFINQKGYAINAYRMEVKGSVVFRKNVTVKGEVNFDGAKVEGHLYWRGLTSNKDLKLNLKYARIGILADDISSWPEKNNLFLSGLIYDEIDVDSPLTVQDRIEWLHLQPTNTFYPQPYEQLASILRKTGREEDAKKVLIEKNRDTALCSQMSFFPWIWHKTKGGVIGYGHRPSKALPFVIGIILLGWLFFGIGFCTNVMTPTNPTLDASANKEPQHVLRGFSKTFIVVESLAYSIDRFVPIVDFNVASNWQPDKDRRGGRFIRVYMWFHIAMGWILTSFLVAAMTGLIRG